jgi:uncharacterized membrane protein YraQ (UPF0718 family)
MFSIITYSVAGLALLWSLAKDRRKTKQALMKAWRSFNNMLPDFAGILALIGLLLSVLSPETISAIMGSRSGMLGMVLAALLGAITLIPGFVAFPLAASLLSRGAGVTQMAVFVSTLMMVGIVTMPLEKKHFGAKATYLRNGLSFLYSFVVALVIGVVVK